MKLDWFLLRRLVEKPRVYELSLPADDMRLPEAREFVVKLGNDVSVPEVELHNIKLAVDEACTNVVRHAYPSGEGGELTVRIEIWSDRFVAKVIDHGKGFDPHSLSTPDLEEYVASGRRGGLGVFLMRRLMDDVRYRRTAEGNELVLVKRFPKVEERPQVGPRVSARLKAGLIGASILTAAVGVIAAVSLARAHASVRERALVQVGMALAALAESCADPLDKREDHRLSSLAFQIADAQKEVQYVAITDASGVAFGHTDPQRLFVRHVAPEGAVENRAAGVVVRSGRVPGGGTAVVEVSVPVRLGARTIGQAAAGMSEEHLASAAAALRRRTALIAGIVWGLLLVGLWFLVAYLVRPVERLLRGITRLTESGAPAKLESKAADEFGEIAEAFNELVDKFQSAQSSLVEQERLRKEMQLAQQIQLALLPSEVPVIEGFDIGCMYRSAKDVGGDLYDFVWVNDQTLGVVVADVSGKGVAGSMVMSVVRTAIRLESKGDASAADALARVNEFVGKDMKRGMFVTISYSLLDSRARTVTFASAGHNPVILYRATEDKTYFLKPSGFPLGLQLEDPALFGRSLEVERLNLAKNDVMVVYTDGITEAMDPAGNLFGEKRLVELIRENAKLPAQQLVDKVNSTLTNFTAGEPQSDDITIVAIKEKISTGILNARIVRRVTLLVQKQGMSVAEACRRNKVSPSTYARWLEERKRGAAPADGRPPGQSKRTPKRGAAAPPKGLSLEERDRARAILTETPDLAPAKLRLRLYEGTKDGGGRLSVPALAREVKRLHLDEPSLEPPASAAPAAPSKTPDDGAATG